MPKQARAYKFTRSLQWALLIGALAGLAVTGLTYTKFVWDLEPREPILLGAGTAFGLTLFLFPGPFCRLAESGASGRQPVLLASLVENGV